jgi:hypothetical protein
MFPATAGEEIHVHILCSIHCVAKVFGVIDNLKGLFAVRF